jgi:hypothetical protein
MFFTYRLKTTFLVIIYVIKHFLQGGIVNFFYVVKHPQKHIIINVMTRVNTLYIVSLDDFLYWEHTLNKCRILKYIRKNDTQTPHARGERDAHLRLAPPPRVPPTYAGTWSISRIPICEMGRSMYPMTSSECTE